MAASQRRERTIFSTVHSEGAILPMDLLQRISDPQNAQLAGLTPDTYYLPTTRLNEAISQAWTRVLGAWQRFKHGQARLSPYESGTTLTREYLLLLFQEMNYSRLQPAKALVVGERSYALSHKWGEHTPIHLVSYKVKLDQSIPGEQGARRTSPHSLLQELLNHSNEHLWGMVSNGLRLRLLRNTVSLTRQAFVEFDLEAMFNGEIYADFVLFWLLCHQSRVEAERPQECWLEKWSREAHATGTRALEQLRVGVERAISELGSGFLSHPANAALRARLDAGTLSAMDYYNQLLHLVYRLLILFVAEDRDVLFDPQAAPERCQLYTDYYSTAKLRYQADRQLGTRHADLYYGLKLIMEKLSLDNGCPELGLSGLNGWLFSPEALVDLNDCQLANYALLAAVRHLAYTESGRTRRIIDYKNLGSEELGSVYESLLELHPIYHLDTGTFELASTSGNVRKTTGSYYTHTSLITSLLDSALDPVLTEACNQASAAEAEQTILNLKICDPACGSGHFLVAAAHRIAKRLAAVRTGDEEPTPAARRHALRDVIGRCIYGVDINPMAVELCKVNLWLEAIEPGKPLSFLDAHIQCGNSLLGTTPALLNSGIPDSAFEAIEGDDKKICSHFKKENKALRVGQMHLFDDNMQSWDRLGDLRIDMQQLDSIPDDKVSMVRAKHTRFDDSRQSDNYLFGKLWADAWCAAFVWKKTAEMRPPLTEADFRAIEKNPYSIATWKRVEIQRLAEQYHFFHWHLAFPGVFHVPRKDEQPENVQAGWSGGFDVVLGNPSWDHTELKEQEWFARLDPDVANAAGAERKRKIEALVTSNSTLYADFLQAKRQQDGWSHFVRNSARYPLCGRGRINTYAIFAETYRLLLRTKGRMGCIVPSGIATDDTTKFFFQNVMEMRALASLYSFENREKLFPAVDSRYNYSLLTLSGSACPITKGADFIFFAHQTEDVQDSQRRFTLSANDIKLLNPNTHTCPIFRSKRDMMLTKAIYERTPVLIKEGPLEENSWNITFRQGIFNMTSDSHLFRTREQLEMAGWRLMGNVFQRGDERYLPLYEGKMIWHFDHRLSTYESVSADFGDLSLAQQQDPYLFSLPRYWVHAAQMPDFTKDGRKALLAFRDIARSTDARTAIFSLVPVVAIGNNLPIGIVDLKYMDELMCLSTYLCSFAFDFVARQKLGGTHMNFFILKQLPVLPPATYTTTCQWDTASTLGDWIRPRALELTYTAWDMEPFAKDCGYDGPPFRWDEERRFMLRCELDAAYFHLYGLAREDVAYVMEAFPIIKRGDGKLYGEYRTQRVILEIYDEMRHAMEAGQAYRTRLVPGPAAADCAHEGR